jgi:hypothetical protein
MRVAILLAVGCGSSATPPTPPTPPVTPRPTTFVVEVGKTLQFYAVDESTVTRTCEVGLPSAIKTLAWAHHQPVLLLGERVARVTTAGMEFLPLPPSHTWKRDQPLDEAVRQDTPSVEMFTKNDEIWLSKCEWAVEGLFSYCRYWVNARLDPAPVITVNDERGLQYGNDQTDKPTKPAAPSPAIRAALVPDVERHKGDRDKLQCTDGSTTIEDPAAGTPFEPQGDNPSSYGRSDLIWLSTDPPIFQVTDWDNCAPCPVAAIFERCRRSTRYSYATFGPDDLIAFHHDLEGEGERIIVFRHGRELATIDHVHAFAFVP